MAGFTFAERKGHYSGVADGTIPTKPSSQYTEEEQRSYNAGRRDQLNDQSMGYLLGKNSPLSEAEKAQLKAERKESRTATPERRAEIKAARQERKMAKTAAPVQVKGKRK